MLSGCAASGGGGDAAKDVVNVVTPAQPSTLDPQISTESIMGEITGSIYETLVVTDENLVPQPMLAESFERSDDGLEYTFVLRDDVTFHTGRPMTADDVKFSFETSLDPLFGSQLASVAKQFTAIEVTNTYPGGYWEDRGFNWFAGL